MERRTLTAALGGLLLPLSMARAQDTEFDRRVEALRGHWFSGGAGAARGPQFVLEVVNVLSAQRGRARLVARWGSAAGRWAEATQALVFEEPGGLRIELTLDAGARVVLKSGVDETLAGELSSGPGGTTALQLARSTVPQIHAWLANHPPARLRARASSVLELVYMSAHDCPPCRGWERENLSGGLPRPELGWEGLGFVVLKRPSFRSPVSPADFPEHLREPVADYLKSRGWAQFRGTPQWAFFVDGAVRTHGFGTDQFTTLVQPTIRAAQAEKRQA
jgi:hypothetical protein